MRCILDPPESVAEKDCLIKLSSPRCAVAAAADSAPVGTSVYVRKAPETRDAVDMAVRVR